MAKHGDNLAELNIPVQVVDFSKVDAQLARLRQSVEGNGSAIDRFSRTAKQSLTRAMQSTNDMLQSMQRVESSSRRINSLWSSIKFGAGAGVGISAFQKLEAGIRRIPSLLAKSVVDSSALKSTERRLQRTFGDLTEDARSFAKDFSKQVGTAESSTKDKLARFAATLEQTGISPDKRFEAAKTMTHLSSDLATAWGTSEDDASMAMLAALRGEADPIERYGLNLKEAAVNAKLFEMGIVGGSRAATESQKVIARLNLIISQTKNIHGEATRSTDTFARETSRLGAKWQGLSEKIGAALEPSATHLTRFFSESLTQIESSLGPIDQLGDRFLKTSQKWTEALGPMRKKLVELTANLPETIAGITDSFADLRKELSFVGEAIEAIGKRIMEVDSLKGSMADWVRGRMRNDDATALLMGSENVNKMNRGLKDLSSTRTTNKEEREEQIAKARIPAIKRMAFMFEDAMSTILGITHGKNPEPPRKSVAGPADETATESPVAAAVQPTSGEATVTAGQPTPEASDTSTESASGKYGEIKPDRRPSRTSPWMTWSKKALEATTGIRTGPAEKTPWEQMTRDQRLESMYNAMKPGIQASWEGERGESGLEQYKNAHSHGYTDENIESIARHQFTASSGWSTEDAEKKLKSLFTPGKSDAEQVFGQRQPPFETIGEAVGKFAGAITPRTVRSTGLKDKISQLEGELMRPQVSFVGLQGVQQHVQAAIGQSIDKDKQQQLELLKKQLEAEQKTEKGITGLAKDMAAAMRPLLGLQ